MPLLSALRKIGARQPASAPVTRGLQRRVEGGGQRCRKVPHGAGDGGFAGTAAVALAEENVLIDNFNGLDVSQKLKRGWGSATQSYTDGSGNLGTLTHTSPLGTWTFTFVNDRGMTSTGLWPLST